MIDKIVGSCADALQGVRDGSVVLVGGFGQVGHPMMLLNALAEQGARELTIVCNNAGIGPGNDGIPQLMKLGRVRRVICSFPRSSEVLTTLFAAGKIELEIVPQGTLVERMRAAGAGIGGFYTRTAAGTLLAHGKEERTIDGFPYILEQPLHGDVALVEAWHADRWGNLTYRQSGRNFNPVMATAAKLTVVQAHHIVGLGEIDPEAVVTPGIFVDRIVQADQRQETKS